MSARSLLNDLNGDGNNLCDLIVGELCNMRPMALYLHHTADMWSISYKLKRQTFSSGELSPLVRSECDLV